MKNRVGLFYIHSLDVEREPELVKRILSDMIIIRCEQIAYKEAFEYHAIGEMFEEVKSGETIPEYGVIVEQNYSNGQSINIRFYKKHK